VNRLLASLWIASTLLLSSCSSEPDVLYEVVDDLVVIDSASWSSRENAPAIRWQSVSSDAGQVAKLGKYTGSETPANHAGPASATYNIDFNKTGLFYLWIRARLASDIAEPTLTVTIAPASENIPRQLADFSDEWQWIPLDVNQNILSLIIENPQLHSLTIATGSTSLLIDKIILTTKPDFLPIGAGPEATLVTTVDMLSNNIEVATEQSEIVAAEFVTAETDSGSTINPVIVDELAEQQFENTNRQEGIAADQIDGVNSQPMVEIQHQGVAVTELILQGGQLQLFANATDDNLPTEALYTYWTKVLGPGDVEFSDQTDAAPVISFSVPGVYTLQVSANDTELYKNALITITVEAGTHTDSTTPIDESVSTSTVSETVEAAQDNSPVPLDTPADMNPAPSVSINGPTTAIAGEQIELTADVSNSNSASPVYHYWNQVHGSGSASIDNIQGQTTTVSFDQAGTYVLQVSASVNTSYANATIEIRVTAKQNDQPTSTISQSSNNTATISQANLNQQSISPEHHWQNSFAKGSPQYRHETSGVAVNGKMYVIGGRGHQPIDVYDSASNSWSKAAKPPIEMHHFQAVAIDNTIYVVGAATCCFPKETNITNVYEFDTQTGQWSKGAAIPANRLRGSTAAAVHNKKIYIVGGNTQGHSGGAVNWFDEFDPATGQWKQLADAPDARDHATIAVVGDKLVVAGGRRSAYPNTFGNTVDRTNVYDLKQQRWQTAANIPTQRAGTMAVGVGHELVVIGGESKASRDAHNAVEAFNVYSGNWRKLSPLPTPRHGGAAAVIDNTIHVVAGSMQIGGAPETNAHEILKK